MIIGRSQDCHGEHRLPSAIRWVGSHAGDAPRFWELEALISAGCDLSEALAVIAARRTFRDGDRRREARPAAATPGATPRQASLS